MRKDHSYGVIPIYKEALARSFFLIQQEEGHWSFPKGHQEAGESGLETAKRELGEETGISKYDITETVSFDEQYFWQHGKIKVDKTVTYFPCFVESQSYKIDGKEIINAGWFTYPKALERLTYDNTKKLLGSVNEWLNSGSDYKLSELTNI